MCRGAGAGEQEQHLLPVTADALRGLEALSTTTRSTRSSSDSTSSSIFSLSHYVDPDSIAHDAIEGFFIAACVTVALLCLYRCCSSSCSSCLDRCGLCPNNGGGGARRKRRHPGEGHEYAAVSTDLYRDSHERGGYRNEYGDCDGSSSGDESDVSLEYGEYDNAHDYDDDRRRGRFDDWHITDDADRYFDREEKMEQNKKLHQNMRGAAAATKGNTNGNKGIGRGNGLRIANAVHRAVSGGTGVIDGEDPAPLDLEMIERKAVEEMEEDPEFAI